MQQIAIACLIFALRITDVSVGTLRVLYTVRGRGRTAAVLGVFEAGVFIFAISRVFKHVDSPLAMAGYACGFAAGTAIGIRLEKWIASGLILVRIISRTRATDLLELLREADFGVTTFDGQGREGAVLMLFAVAKRRRGSELLRLVRESDPDAFVTVESVTRAVGGYLPHVTEPSSVRK
jgi:uncharacterized protein YebE (UPF0316 family)